MENKILLIVNDVGSRQKLSELLGPRDYSIACLYDPELAQATADIWSHQFDLVILDEEIRGASGLDIMESAHLRRRDLPVIVMSHGEGEDALYAVRTGAAHYMTYAVNPSLFMAMVENALGRGLVAV